MDPHSFIARAEAQRWLGIAEKLLMGHDLVGSKTFAIRARDSDPRLEAAEQILAIADTLLAAEKRVVGNNGAQQPDYYAILQLVRFVQDTDHIASQYRRLAVLLNPHQNRFPYSDQAFQLVNEAGSVLSNPMRKSMYDSELEFPPQQQMNSIGFNLEQQHHQQQHHHHQQQQHNFFSINHMGSSHEQEMAEPPQTFQTRVQQSHQQQQLQQHNFLSQPNPVRPLPVREQEHMYQHREQEQLFQPQVQPFQITSESQRQTRQQSQPPQPQSRIQSPTPPPAASPHPPFSWPQAPPMSQSEQHHLQQQLQQKQRQQQLQEEQKRQQQIQEEQKRQQQLQEEQKRQQQLQEEQKRQQQIQEEQKRQQQLQEEQRRQQQLQEEQKRQQQLLEEQKRQQQIFEEQKRQQQLLEEQKRQQQLQEEQKRQQKLLEEQKRQQQLLEEQKRQQLLQEEQKRQQQLQEEQKRQQQLQEEQKRQQQLQEEQKRQQHFQEEQKRQQQLQEEQKRQQLLEEQKRQQQLQEEQQVQHQQRQESVLENTPPVHFPNQVNINNGAMEEDTETEEAPDEDMDDSPTFWTSCPYCFYMYEYPKLYAECTLRCDHCERAFQAVRIPSPPPIVEGNEAYYYCWGYFPVGVSMPQLEKTNTKGNNSNWTPFSSFYNASSNVQNHLNGNAAPKTNTFVNKSSGPRIYFDDVTDDVFIDVSEPSDSDGSDDDEWDIRRNKSKRLNRDPDFKTRPQVLALMAKDVTNGSVKNRENCIPVHEGVGVSPVPIRRQSGRIATKELGKLDLNVEFNNNEGEEGGPRVTGGGRGNGNGEDDNIEGIGFFEGLDEFLSSLPILSVVNEEKVTAA